MNLATRLAITITLGTTACVSARPGVVRGESMRDKIGQPVELDGVAGNAKAGAIVQVGNTPVYLAGIAAWPRGWDGAAVRVKGTLREQKLIPDPINERGELTQGAPGKQLVLEGASWEKRP